MPPCGSDTAGRPLSEVITTYVQYRGQGLTEYDTISEGIYVSKFEGLTLAEYCTAREYITAVRTIVNHAQTVSQ